MSVTIPDRFLAMAPFLAASVLYAVSPEFTKVARWRIASTVSAVKAPADATAVKAPADATAVKAPADATAVPPLLSPGYIGDYVEYGIDVAQLVPMLLLPLVGVLVSWHLGLNPGIAWVVFAGTFIILIIVTIRFLNKDPINYVSKKLFGRYTLLSRTGLVVNLVAAGLVGAFV